MKALIYGSVFVFSTIGSLIPAIWHQGMFSLASIIGAIIGTIVGVWVAIKLNNYF